MDYFIVGVSSFKSVIISTKELLIKTPVSFFVFVSLLIVTYFLLKLIPEWTESNLVPPYEGAYGIKKAVQGTIDKFMIWGNRRYIIH